METNYHLTGIGTEVSGGLLMFCVMYLCVSRYYMGTSYCRLQCNA